MNKKGFTLIELLATIIVFSIIFTIGIASINNSITKSRDESTVNLAKNYAESVRTMRANNALLCVPKNGEAAIVPYSEIEGLEISNKDKTGYGYIFPSYSYIGIVNNNNNYLYYINQVDETYHLLDRVNYNTVDSEDVKSSEDYYSGMTELKGPYSSFSIEYEENTYSIKGLRVEYSAKYVQESGKLRTAFDLKDQKIRFKGELIFNNTLRKIELRIESNQLNYLDNRTYTLRKPNANDSSNTGLWVSDEKVNGKKLKVNIEGIENDKIFFDFLVGDDSLYSGITSSTSVKLSGYYTIDDSYAISSAQIKGNMSAYDHYVQTNTLTGTNNNIVVVNGVNYQVNGSKLKCLIVKK